MDRGRPQERPHPNPSTVDRRGNAVGLHSFLWSRTYGNRNTRGVPERVLGRNWRPDPNQLPRSPRTRRTCLANPGKTLRKPFAAQEVAIAGAVKRLQQANSVAIIAEMGTGKTLMAMAIAHVFAAGRPYACLFVVPPQLLQKTAREILQTIPGARTYVIDSLRSLRPGQSGPQGVNELRLRNGRIVRDGVHTTLTDMRLRANTNPLGTVGLPSTGQDRISSSAAEIGPSWERFGGTVIKSRGAVTTTVQ
jgi:hypothetical protein